MPAQHKTRKLVNCETNPRCLFGFGIETKEAGIWAPQFFTNVLGPDPVHTLKQDALIRRPPMEESHPLFKYQNGNGNGNGNGSSSSSGGGGGANGKGKKGKAPKLEIAPGKTGLGNLGAT